MFLGDPDAVKQHGKLSGHCDNGPIPCLHLRAPGLDPIVVSLSRFRGGRASSLPPRVASL
jgi:hypothetical protein